MIHFIGDSHSSIFSGNYDMQPIWPERSNDIIENFKSYRIGPATSYKLDEKGPIILDILNSQVNKDSDFVFFCFGEIDCRAHLIKQSQIKSVSIDSVVDECVTIYFEVIKKYKNMGFNVGVWGPIASWSDIKPYTGPSYGTEEERNKVTKLFNQKIELLCNEKNIPFTTMFYDMVTDDMKTNETFLDDWEGCHIHLNQNAISIILEKFKKLNLI